MMEDCKKFFNKMEELKPYLVKFNKNGTIRSKTYLPNYTIKGKDCWPLIIIIQNKYIFLAKNGTCKA